MNGTIEIFDTTLRDGAQGEGISFSVQDKIAITMALDELGVMWIEAGNPGSNPKDNEFFKLARKLHLKNSKLCAFGATRKKGIKAENDLQLISLLEAGTKTVVIFGKSSVFHVKEVLKVSLDENLAMIAETIEFLIAEGRTVIYDAEHFFDGLLQNKEYALKAILTAASAGAGRIVLCDTNGGSFPTVISGGVLEAAAALGRGGSVRPACGAGARGGSVDNAKSMAGKGNHIEKNAPPILGIHAHNDCGLAIACSIAALEAGCTHVQGTLAGFGERCGNTALAALLPSLELKMKCRCLPEGNLKRISEISRRVAEIANCTISDDMPYIGAHAFSHKAGMHVDAILKAHFSFEHIDPSLVGNGRHFLMSEQGGRSGIAERVRAIMPSVTKENPAIGALSKKLKALEADGWAYDGADASFEILVRKELGIHKKFFQIIAYRVQSEHPNGPLMECCHAWVKVLVGDRTETAAAEGSGPVNALDQALRRSLLGFYPQLQEMRLSDYKVRVIDGKDATAAKVRVLVESTRKHQVWTTVGVSADIINASCIALIDSIEYKLTWDTL